MKTKRNNCDWTAILLHVVKELKIKNKNPSLRNLGHWHPLLFLGLIKLQKSFLHLFSWGASCFQILVSVYWVYNGVVLLSHFISPLSLPFCSSSHHWSIVLIIDSCFQGIFSVESVSTSVNSESVFFLTMLGIRSSWSLLSWAHAHRLSDGRLGFCLGLSRLHSVLLVLLWLC